jgi:hypothetical protein
MSYYAYDGAMRSKRAHLCAEASNPTEETWKEIKRTVVTDSECGGKLAFLSDDDDDSDSLELNDDIGSA